MNTSMERLENVAATFEFEWKAHSKGQFQQETLFGNTLDEYWQYFLDNLMVTEDDLRGATVLDAGCGPGRYTRQIGEHGARLVVGLDINDAVDEAFQACRELSNVQIVQGNILAPPFKPHLFDLVWCVGVLHHTPNASEAHHSLSRYIAPEGTMFVWVYAKRFNPFRFTKDILDSLHVTRLPPRVLMSVASVFSYISIFMLWIYRAARKMPPLRPRSAWGERTMRPRRRQDLHLTWFDALSPEYNSRHREAEVIGWFRREGFTGIRAIEEPKVGVRGVAPTGHDRADPEYAVSRGKKHTGGT
jgi:SAM-dependent methyltransferase